jgi:sugar lactone lactonase YvrE
MKYLLSISFLLILSCESFSEKKEQESNVLFSFTNALRSKASTADAKSIVISIEQSGTSVYDKANLTLFDFNGSMVTTPLALPVGNYSITEFFVLDSLDSVIFATPLEGSALANLVTDPLPIEFSVISNQTVTVNPQVISTESNNPSDFGFFGLGFGIVETFDFLVSVQIFENGAFTLAAATVDVESDGHLDYSQTIPNTITTIKARDITAATYTVTISKAGYEDYQQNFTRDSLQTFAASPLTVVLEEDVYGTVITFAGSTQAGFADGIGSAARFSQPFGVAVDASGNVYVADYFNDRIRKITVSGLVSTFAGTGVRGYLDGDATVAQFSGPYGVAVDSLGNVYVADSQNHCIRKITQAGTVTTLAGSTNGYQEGVGTAAQFSFPYDVSVDDAGNLYVADVGNQRIRKITTTGLVTTFAGGSYGSSDGVGTSAQFKNPFSVAVDFSGNVFVADIFNHRIRKISPSGLVTTFAGSSSGYADGNGSAAQFQSPTGVAVDAAGNVFVADQGNNRIRKISINGDVTLYAGHAIGGYLDGSASSAKFNQPKSIAVDLAGNVYVGDQNNHCIRKITL